MNRIDRLSAIIVQLQTKRVIKAEEIADRFSLSLRTVYRDIKALVEAGVPIGSEAGKGYYLVDGYHLPPVMFTQDEASAMLLAGKLIEKLGDKSIFQSFDSALLKVKAVLRDAEKEHLESLQNFVKVLDSSRSTYKDEVRFPDNFLTSIQRAVVEKKVLEIQYASAKNESTRRELEPIGIFYYGAAWHLIAWCRLRKSYRDFRADRISSMLVLEQDFKKQHHLTLDEYIKSMQEEREGLLKAVVLFDKNAIQGRDIYGSLSQTDLGDKIAVEFLIDNLKYLAQMLLMYGDTVEVQSPQALRDMMQELSSRLFHHYNATVPV